MGVALKRAYEHCPLCGGCWAHAYTEDLKELSDIGYAQELTDNPWLTLIGVRCEEFGCGCGRLAVGVEGTHANVEFMHDIEPM